MQLLKLVYFAHGWHLALGKGPLVKERFEAWKFGPVSPPIYHAFKSYRMNAITKKAEVLDPDVLLKSGVFLFNEPTLGCAPEDRFAKSLVKQVFEVYGGLSGPQMSAITHRDESAWHKAWIGNQGFNRPGTDVDENDILVEFQALTNGSKKEAA